MNFLRDRGLRAFSLVEVAIAIGIIAFCIIAVIGLLPIGLNAIKTSREEAAASKCLEQIAFSIRGASSNMTNYRAWGAYSNLSWTLGGSDVNLTFSNLSLGGVPTSIGLDQRLVARVQLRPPASKTFPGTALISVAWPSHAVWNDATTNWIQSQGAVSTWMVFLPRE